MIENNFLVLLLGLIVGLASYVFSSKKNLRENFLPSMTYKVDKVAAPNRDFANKGDFWSVPGTYQSLVAPRSASMAYGSQIQYNLPPESILAYRAETPFANDGLSLDSGDGGGVVQPITYDRFMFSNKKSRLREHGDPIRGDLPIAPLASGWFRPSVQPHIDLKEGAMQVMGGFDNDTNNQLSMLMAASAGAAMQTFGGSAFSGSDGLSTDMGAFMRSPNDQRNPSASDQRLASTGMVPQYDLQSTVGVERSGDIHVMRG
jgi:Family of unknown function (DUF5850)